MLRFKKFFRVFLLNFARSSVLFLHCCYSLRFENPIRGENRGLDGNEKKTEFWPIEQFFYLSSTEFTIERFILLCQNSPILTFQ